MRRLILMRHGEAENEGAAGDKARRLTSAGISAVLRCGQEIRAKGFSPELALSSDAERAMQTLSVAMRGGALTGISCKSLRLLYLADTEAIIAQCAETDDTISTILAIGHNPGWSDCVVHLTGVPVSLGTAEAALIEHPGDFWAKCLFDPQAWKLKNLIP